MRTHCKANIRGLFSILPVCGLLAPHLHADSTQTGCEIRAMGQFIEGAPTDRFIFTNESDAGWSISRLELELGSSTGNLIFDTTDQGAGVDVFQPFKSETGSAALLSQPTVDDGDQRLELVFSHFKPSESFQFTIDLDDQLSDSDLGQIRISDSEIQGATVQINVVSDTGQTTTLSAEFDQSSALRVVGNGCS